MARIRTIKPEAFQSETLASVGVAAERTFFGLTTQADDSGRFRWQPAVLNGFLWSLRPKHTAEHLASELEELREHGALCRYTGCDGKVYGHFPTWRSHQRVDRPSASRIPPCPHHPDPKDAQCPKHDGECPTPASRGLDEDSTRTREPGAPGSRVLATDLVPRTVDLGPWTDDLPTTSGAIAPRGDGAHDLLAEHLAACRKRPPDNVIGQLAKHTKSMLDQGIDPDDIRNGLARFRQKPMHPSVLPSLVNEAMNAPLRPAAPAKVAYGDAVLQAAWEQAVARGESA